MVFIDKETFKDKIGIYLIENKSNGKVYIGQTSMRFYKRFLHHCWKLRNNAHDNKMLQEDFNNFGESEFQFKVIEVLDKKSEAFDTLEIKYIEDYKTRCGVYNIQKGGKKSGMTGVAMSESTKKKIGDKNKINMTGRKASEETKKKMSESRTGLVRKDLCKLSDEMARKIKEMLMNGQRPSEVAKAIGVDYRIVNNIFSNNTYKHIKIIGWDDFYKHRPKYLHCPRVLSQEQIEEIKRYKECGYTDNQLAEKYGVSRDTIRLYKK